MIRRISIRTQEISISRQTNNIKKSKFPSDPPPDYRHINRRGHLSLEEANKVYFTFDPPPPYEPNNIQCTPVVLPSYEDATRDSHSTQTENTNITRNTETMTTNSNNSNPQITTIFNNTNQSNQQTTTRRRRNPFSGCCRYFGRIFNRNRSDNTLEYQNHLPSYENVLLYSIRQCRISILEIDTMISSRIGHCNLNGINTRTDPQLAQLRDQRQDMSYNLENLLYRL